MLSKIGKIPNILRNEGLRGIVWRIRIRVSTHQYLKDFQKSYNEWYSRNSVSTIESKTQVSRLKKLKKQPLISVVTPVYNTPLKFLTECIDSVRKQSYGNWELLLVDDCSTDEGIWPLLTQYAHLDSRIKIKRLKTNGHICEASNAALGMVTGEWVAILDHDDILWPNALFEVVQRINQQPQAQFIYSDEDKLSEDGKMHCDVFFKPDWSPHFLRSINYITHFAVIKRELIDTVDGFTRGTEGAQDWDLFLRATRELEKSGHCHPWDPVCPIQHIGTVLYSWRKSPTSTSSSKHALKAKKYAYDAQRVVLQADIDKRGGGEVCTTRYLGVWQVIPKLRKLPLISIIIPTRDNLKYLQSCLESILRLTAYKPYEIIIVDTGSTLSETWDYYKQLDKNVRVINDAKPSFNYSATVNRGVASAEGEYVLFLNDDTILQTPQWLERMLSYAQLPEVGVVGCRLLYPGGKIQHTGLVVGHETGRVLAEQVFVSNYFRMADPTRDYGVSTLFMDTLHDYTAVTAACLLIDKRKHKLVQGFDETLAIAFNDVDYCLKLQAASFFNIVIPGVVLTHHESVSVGRPDNGSRDLQQFANEIKMMKKRWGKRLEHDAYFSDQLELKDGLPYARV